MSHTHEHTNTWSLKKKEQLNIQQMMMITTMTAMTTTTYSYYNLFFTRAGSLLTEPYSSFYIMLLIQLEYL